MKQEELVIKNNLIFLRYFIRFVLMLIIEVNSY